MLAAVVLFGPLQPLRQMHRSNPQQVPIWEANFAQLMAMVQAMLSVFFPTVAEQKRAAAGAGEGAGAGGGNFGGGGGERSVAPDATKQDPFETLGLAARGEGVTEADVKKAYRKLSLKWHPDVTHGCRCCSC